MNTLAVPSQDASRDPARSGQEAAAPVVHTTIVMPNGDVAADLAANDLDLPKTLAERITWSAAVWGLFLMLGLGVAMIAKPVLMPLALGFVIATTLSPLTRRVRKLGMRPAIAAGVVMAGLLSVVVIAAWSVLLPAWGLLQDVAEPLKALGAQAQAWLVQFGIGVSGTRAVGDLLSSNAAADGLKLAGSSIIALMPVLMITLATALLLAYFMLAFGDRFLTKLVRTLPTVNDKVGALRITRAVQRDLGLYLATITWINLGLAAAVTLLATWFGLPVPMFWGAMVGALNYIPYAGPATSLVLLGLAGLCFLSVPGEAAILVAALAVIFFIEGQILNPLLMGQRLKMNPLVVFMAVLFWGWLWGVFGMLLAIPLLIMVKRFSDRFPGWKPVSSFLSR
jgi:predicted PurR-regulated permease PerM